MSNRDEFPLPVDDTGEHGAIDEKEAERAKAERSKEERAHKSSRPTFAKADRLRGKAADRPPSSEEMALPEVDDIENMLESYSGAMRSVLDVKTDPSPDAFDDLDLDYAAMPERMRRSAVARDMAERGGHGSDTRSRRPFSSTPVAPGTAIVPDRADRGRRRRRGRQGAASEKFDHLPPEVAAQVEAVDSQKGYHVKRSKRGLMVVSAIFMLVFGGVWFAQYQIKRASIAKLKAPLEALFEERGPLYQQLASQIEADRAPANDFCPRLGEAQGDTTFFFDGAGPAGLPTENFIIRELTRIDSHEDDTLTEAHIRNAISQLSRAVVYVRVHTWRSPSFRGGDRAVQGGYYSNVAPGYVIGDAFVGDAESNLAVCSFRFFASSSPQIRQFQGGQSDLDSDFYAQVYEGVGAGIRGMRATPGTRPGRYRSTTPPTGF